MTHTICEPCIGVIDTACVDVCPVDCIHGDDKMMYIDPETCIDCGACIDACPVLAIFTEEDVPDEWKHFTEMNAAFFQK